VTGVEPATLCLASTRVDRIANGANRRRTKRFLVLGRRLWVHETAVFAPIQGGSRGRVDRMEPVYARWHPPPLVETRATIGAIRSPGPRE